MRALTNTTEREQLRSCLFINRFQRVKYCRNRRRMAIPFRNGYFLPHFLRSLFIEGESVYLFIFVKMLVSFSVMVRMRPRSHRWIGLDLSHGM